VAFEPVLTSFVREPNSHTLDFYIQRARGYRFILVNGRVTVEDDRETNVHSGRLLRHGDG